MKRIILIFCLGIVLCASAFATYDLFGGSLSFSWFDGESLYPEAAAYPFSSSSALHILLLQEGQPRTVKYGGTGSGEYDDMSIYHSGQYADETMYLQLKTGLNIGFLRFSYKHIAETELGFQGSLNTVFQGFGGADNLGFDGVFFFGLNTRIFERVSMRVGYRHYSGHYGDETLLKLSASAGYPIEYTRDNNLLFGISVRPISWARMYADASLPMTNTWMHPAIHIPSWVIKRTNGQPLHTVEAGNEGIPTTAFDESYKAWILNFGAEFRYPVRKLGSLFAGIDVISHQDGQTLHRSGGYDPGNPWEFEYTVAAGIEFEEVSGLGDAKLLVQYHDGRFPLLNFFYHRSSYFGVGFFLST
ncbi:MAG: hypothetical protein GXY60_10525 [Spirochaetales bacterium]|jgi:hypothetical protein|nr:hypothetical protein [Sphaerochaetaceae bacterium]NLV84990.1 hypothetical protein [Spirochaetales bacterium]